MSFFKQRTAFLLAALLGTMSIASCDLDVPDLNNPGLGELQDTPTAALVNSACVGLFIGNRGNIANGNGYISQLGILGRESFNFDAADPRYITEMLTKPLDRASPFGGNFWGGPYTNIRLANIILAGVEKVPEFTDADVAAIKGFAKTSQAMDLLEVIDTHDTNGAVIDTDKPLGSTLGAIASKEETHAKIISLLDEGYADLAGAGDSFSFAFTTGYDGFDTPAEYRKFNRAIRARVSVYAKKYSEALTALSESFLDDTSAVIPLDLGVYHVYSNNAGDANNGLINKNIYAHPTLETDAQKNGAVVDARFTRKVGTASKPGSNGGLASTLQFKIYTSGTSPVPLIRNEELVLLKAEALYFTNDKAGALAELNLIRVQSGGLAPLTAPATDEEFVDQLLYERRYSLLFEGGHRWLDLRRFGRELPLDRDTDVRNVRYPIPQAECDGRPGEAACEKTSI